MSLGGSGPGSNGLQRTVQRGSHPNYRFGLCGDDPAGCRLVRPIALVHPNLVSEKGGAKRFLRRQ